MKFGLFYQLPCAPEQQTSSRYQQTLGQIQYADELGFDTAWLAGWCYPCNAATLVRL